MLLNTNVMCMKEHCIHSEYLTKRGLLGPVAQSVESLTAYLGVASLNLALSHTFTEIDHEIISTVILLFQLIQEWLLSVKSKSMCSKYWVTA